MPFSNAHSFRAGRTRRPGQPKEPPAIGIVLIPLILVTGSRSGLLLAAIGLGFAALLYAGLAKGRNREVSVTKSSTHLIPILAGVSIASISFLTFFFSRAEAIERLFFESSSDRGRSEFWALSVDLFFKYFPWGSGSGSFVEAYQIIEPDAMLSAKYLNRAHNDWLETAVTFGLPGLLLISAGILIYLKRGYEVWFRLDGSRQSVAYSRMAGASIAILAVASVSDYPLRTPIMMCIFVVFTLWYSKSATRLDDAETTLHRGDA